jgi:DNA anti-recombination protein RmuC
MTNLLDTKFVQIFVKSPVTVLLLLSVVALAYSQQQNDKLYQQQITEYKEELKEVKAELKSLQDKVFHLKK